MLLAAAFLLYRRRSQARGPAGESSPFSFQNPVYQANQDGGEVKIKESDSIQNAMTSGVPVAGKSAGDGKLPVDYLRAFDQLNTADTNVLVDHDANDDTMA